MCSAVTGLSHAAGRPAGRTDIARQIRAANDQKQNAW